MSRASACGSGNQLLNQLLLLDNQSLFIPKNLRHLANGTGSFSGPMVLARALQRCATLCSFHHLLLLSFVHNCQLKVIVILERSTVVAVATRRPFVLAIHLLQFLLVVMFGLLVLVSGRL